MATAIQIAAVNVTHNHFQPSEYSSLKRRLNDAVLEIERRSMMAEDAQGQQRIMEQASHEKRQRIVEPLMDLVDVASRGVTHLSDVLEEDLEGSTDDNIICTAVVAEDILTTVTNTLRGATAILDEELGRE